ncbi:MAG: MFS transporter [Dehalococcoidia bacterium]
MPRTASSDRPEWWAGMGLLRHPPLAALITSNTLMSLGGGMQLLLHGWLAVSWGGSLWMLVAFAASRMVPKVLLTIPAGVLCDRLPRARLLGLTRGVDVAASLLPLVGFVAPMPLLWVLAGSSIAGAVHAFDLPAGRGAMADMTEPTDLHAAVALNSAGHQAAALLGPALAFGLASWPGRPAALAVSALVLAGAALVSRAVPSAARPDRAHGTRRAPASFVRYLISTPPVLLLIVASAAPGVVDRAIALILPSAAGSGGSVGFALVAPEVGALLAAAVLAVAPVRLGAAAVLAGILLYAGLIVVASQNTREAQMLVLTLGVAGMARLIVNATAQARLQYVVPAEVRGRVFAV